QSLSPQGTNIRLWRDSFPDLALSRSEQRNCLGGVFLEVRRLLVRLEGRFVLVDLVQHDLRLVVRIDEHFELPAAGFLARLARVFVELAHERIDVVGSDPDIDLQDEHAASLAVQLAGVTSAPTRSTISP